LKFLEESNSFILHQYSKLVMPDKIDERTLAFANMGIGNIMWFLPTLKIIGCSTKLDVVCDKPGLKDLLEYNINCSVISFNQIKDIGYKTSVNNFLCQSTEEVKKIISLRIPNRIGHVWKERLKYSWLFNIPYPTDDSVHEMTSNLNLWNSSPYEFVLELPATEKVLPKYDILFQVHSFNEPEKDYPNYSEVINLLDKSYSIAFIGGKEEWGEANKLASKYHLSNYCGKLTFIEALHLIKNSRMIIGNDGGLLKCADMMAAPAIQIFRYWSKIFERVRILRGSNLIEPKPVEVIKSIKEILK
jgi:hypothetical protein